MNFEPLTIRDGLLLDIATEGGQIRVRGWSEKSLILNDPDITHFGFVTSGWVPLVEMIDSVHNSGPPSAAALTTGMYFVVVGPIVVTGMNGGRGLVISLSGYRGMRQFGGPVEADGRLTYIDGCSDTILVSPPRRGDPCLNHLHIPPHVNQTPHTHPSERIGVILRGSGECRTHAGVHSLEAGMGWRIPPGCIHSFHTSDDSLDVIAWHPDSDFGPTDEDHPMINRTVIE